jgi:4-amino-4-deoxy-L-arabinose transferase-like glycosyltransferase
MKKDKRSMPSTRTQKRGRNSKPQGGQISFTIEPETKVQITIESGAVKAGKMPVTVHIDRVSGKISGRKKKALVSAGRLRAAFEVLLDRLKDHDLGTWLFITALAVYLLTRLIGLDQYPIYFFTDEANQTQSMADLIASGYRDGAGTLLPTYFRNGEYANLGLSVYLQWLPLILFGKSAVVTRAASVFVTLIAAISVGIILREIFKAKYWWLGTLLLSITPAWFLHSRTAFETAEFTAFYAGTLCAYLLYRYRSPRYLYLALFLGALAFYTYSPGQMIVPLTAIALLFSDWRYHWENRRTALKGLALLAALAMPYLRFRMNDPDAAVAHLHTLGSYLLVDAPLFEKIKRYFFEYFTGLSAWYWYQSNDRDLARHLMDGYGNIMPATLPFAILGMAQVLRRLREPAYRAILIGFRSYSSSRPRSSRRSGLKKSWIGSKAPSVD